MSSNTRPTRWRALATGDDLRHSRRIIEEIAAELAGAKIDTATLSGGTAGQALFFGYAHAAIGDTWLRDKCLGAIEETVATLDHPTQRAGLYSGIAGSLFAIENLRKLGIEELGEFDLSDLYESLITVIDSGPWGGDFDLINGLVGLGVCALESSDAKISASMNRAIVQRLYELSEVNAHQSRTWHTPLWHLLPWQREDWPNGCFNCGLAHGVPGALAYLSHAALRQLHPASASMVEGTHRWLLSTYQGDGSDFAFPTIIPVDPGEERPKFERSRLAWCYGDLGISMALLLASLATGRVEDDEFANRILTKAARRSSEDAYWIDASLCHGLSGIAHQFARAANFRSNEVVEGAAGTWLRRTLDFQHSHGGPAGFAYPKQHDGQYTWTNNTSLLEGIAGIGLALISFAYPIVPAWDRILLTDLPIADDVLQMKSSTQMQ